MPFTLSANPPETRATPGYWCIFKDQAVLVDCRDAAMRLPMLRDLDELGLAPLRTQFVGWMDDAPCYAADIPADSRLSQENFAFKGLRELLFSLPEEFSRFAGRAAQVLDWDRTHQFCGQCGAPTEQLTGELAKRCPACGLTNYPRISPVAIVAVVRDRRILLARAPRFQNNMYSVIAGYAEAGETLEECARREVMEEVGIAVKNIRYFGSQPWSLSNSLMVGFTAEYAGGEICVDGVETIAADWFSAVNLPNIPDPYTISRKLIDWFVEHDRDLAV